MFSSSAFNFNLRPHNTEERTFAALGGQGQPWWKFCKFRSDGGHRGDAGEHSWKCGCASDDIEDCRPLPLREAYEGMELAGAGLHARRRLPRGRA